MHHRVAIAVLAALPFGLDATQPATGIRFAPAEGLALRKTFENVSQQELDWMRVTVDGQEQDQDQSQEFESSVRLVVVDRYVAVGDERVTKLERSFEEFEGESSAETSSGGEDHSMASETSCELVGHSVVFTWDPDEEAYVAGSEDEEVESDWLEDLSFDLDFLALLPDGEVEVGDEWEVDAEKLRDLLRFEHGLPLDAEHSIDGETQDRPEDDEDEPEKEESVSGDLTARLAGLREVDGALLAVIELSGEYEATSDSERTTDGEHGSQTAETSQTTTVELEGECLWNLAAGHFHSCALDAEAENQSSADITAEFMDQTMELSHESSATGSVRYTASFEPAE